jgi:hypothetical protein
MAELELRKCKKYKEKCGYMLCYKDMVGYTATYGASQFPAGAYALSPELIQSIVLPPENEIAGPEIQTVNQPCEVGDVERFFPKKKNGAYYKNLDPNDYEPLYAYSGEYTPEGFYKLKAAFRHKIHGTYTLLTARNNYEVGHGLKRSMRDLWWTCKTSMVASRVFWSRLKEIAN